MNPQRPVSENQSYVLLTIDSTRLLLIQSDIRALGGVIEVDSRNPLLGSAGWVRFQDIRRPVYSLSKELVVQTRWPNTRRICALLRYSGGFFGLLADDMEILGTQPLTFSALPACMKRPGTPIEGITTFRDGIACNTSAKSLAIYLNVAGKAQNPFSDYEGREHVRA